ncbi:MAG: ChaN family lipoprotein [Phycisphaerae bacterium]
MDVRTRIAICHGRDGSDATWAEMMQAVNAADVVILGEMHDDAIGHRVQRAVWEDVVDQFPESALSMEMLDRRKQATVDDYLAELIDRDKFYERIAMTRWRKISKQFLDWKIGRGKFKQRIMRIGWPDWEHNYQPMIDAAKTAGATVVAANTPWLLYSTFGAKNGYDRLDGLTDAQKRLFERPFEVYGGSYRERFWKVIVGRPENGTEEETEADTAADADTETDVAATTGTDTPTSEHDVSLAQEESDDTDAKEGKTAEATKTEPEEPAHEGLDDEAVARMYRGQLVMDATMADSIADALASGATKVVHLVGQFHCDFSGGLVQELRHRAPDARILVISLQPRDEPAWIDEDKDRADFIAFTRVEEGG